MLKSSLLYLYIESSRKKSLVEKHLTDFIVNYKQACTIRFRLPTGELKNRRFVHSLDNLQSVVDFVGSLGYLTNEFHIIKSYPKDNVSFFFIN